MNLIANRHLDGSQKLVIQELTLKKRQSKKSTMSERQRAARQQLAKELMLERRVPPSLGSVGSQQTIDSLATTISSGSSGCCCCCSQTNSSDDQQSLLNESLLHHQLTPSLTCNSSSTTTTTTTCRCHSSASSQAPDQQQTTEQAKQTQLNSPQCKESSGHCAKCNFTRSDSSYSGSSASIITQDSNVISDNKQTTQLMIDQQQLSDEQRTDCSREKRKKEANIRVHKLKLEHLNFELERKLHQYEYLVEQEKALLGTYNMMLFTNQGVNNFHLHRDI